MSLVLATLPPYNSEMVSARQIKAARALLGWSQQELADRAGVARNTMAGIENGSLDPRTSTLRRVVQALQDAGIEFTTDAAGEGVRLRRQS